MGKYSNHKNDKFLLEAFALSKGINWEYEKMEREAYLNAMIQSVTNYEQLWFYHIKNN